MFDIAENAQFRSDEEQSRGVARVYRVAVCSAILVRRGSCVYEAGEY